MSEYNLTFRELEEGKIYRQENFDKDLAFKVKDNWLWLLDETNVEDGWDPSHWHIEEYTRFKLKEEKKRYWIWVLLKGGRYFESDDFADNDGVGTSGNKIYFGDNLFKKLEDRYIDV